MLIMIKFLQFFYVLINLIFVPKEYRRKYLDLKGMSIISALGHYLFHGFREGRSPVLYFDEKYYMENNPDVKNSRYHPYFHYLKYGSVEGRKPNGIKIDRGLIATKIQNGEFSEALRSLNLNRVYSLDKDRRDCSLMAVALNRSLSWAKSRKMWLRFEYLSSCKNTQSLHSYVSLFDAKPLSEPFEVISPYSTKTKRKLKVCIYTSLYGDYDQLSKIPSSFTNEVDYILFTDRDITVSGWKTVVVNVDQPTHNLKAKYFKLQPHKCLEDYDASLFVDASTEFLTDPIELINYYLSQESFVMFQHPRRNCLYDEAEAILYGGHFNAAVVVDQVSEYQKKGYVEGSGLCEASFIWRLHNDSKVIAFMDEWWKHNLLYSSRDQLSFAFLIWKLKFRPKILDNRIGSSRENRYFFKKPHLSKGNKGGENIKANLLSDIAFIYSEKYKNTGSTTMRGRDLVQALDKSLESDINFQYTSNFDQEGKGIWLTKGVLKDITLEEITKIKDRNLFVAADFVDDKLRKELLKYIDILIASSIKQYIYYKTYYPDKLIFRIDHLVDRRLPSIKVLNEAKVGYFGELINALHSEGISDLVDIYLVNTKVPDSSWLEDLKKYNVHYSVRKKQSYDGYKPFLKGFTAAHCDSVLMVARDESDAAFCLPPNYPYFSDTKELNDVRAVLLRIIDGFNSKEWGYAKECMENLKAQSSDKTITDQFKILLMDITV